jgi:hypothetical protein
MAHRCIRRGGLRLAADADRRASLRLTGSPETADLATAKDDKRADGRRRRQKRPTTEVYVINIKEALSRIMQLDGAMGACVVDSNSGMMLGSDGSNTSINLEVAAAGNTEVVRAKRKTMKSLNLKDSIEDILITLHSQYHIIRPLGSNDALFIYAVLDKGRSNLALARHQLAGVEKDLAV